MSSDLRCWNCGTNLSTLSLPLGREDKCPDCSNYLNVCRMCSNFDIQVTDACREDDAEEVREKSRPNFCDYFKPSASAFDPLRAEASASSVAELERLFDTAGATSEENTSTAAAGEDSPQLTAEQ